MARRLKAYVHVDGTAYGPGDDVPAEVAERIGDHAWDDGGDQDDAEPRVGYTDPTARQLSGGGGEAPPRSGRGSGVEAWRTYAAQNNLDVADDAGREDIIAAAEDAGLIEREE